MLLLTRVKFIVGVAAYKENYCSWNKTNQLTEQAMTILLEDTQMPKKGDMAYVRYNAQQER